VLEWLTVSGTDLYACGVPLTETQFREVFAAYQSELDELQPPADRTAWEMKRQFAAAQRLAVLTGTHPHAFPNVGDTDQAWECTQPATPTPPATCHMSMACQ
jgi:hypothetical protein